MNKGLLHEVRGQSLVESSHPLMSEQGIRQLMSSTHKNRLASPQYSLECVECAGVALVLVLQSSPQHKKGIREGGSYYLTHSSHA